MRNDLQELLAQLQQAKERSAQSPAGFTEEEVNSLAPLSQEAPFDIPPDHPMSQEAPPQAAPPEAMQTRMPATEMPVAPPEAASPGNPAFEAALQKRAEMERMSGMIRGFKNLIGASTGYKPDHTISDEMTKRGQRGVDEYQAGEKAKKEATQEEQANELAKIKIGKAEYDFANAQKTGDPNSPESKLAQDMFLANAKKTETQVDEAQIRKITAKDLHANSKFLQDELARMYKQKSADQKAQERSQERTDRAQERAGKEEATQQRHDERESGRAGRSNRNLGLRKEKEERMEGDQERERTRKISKDITARFDKMKSNKVYVELDKQGLTFQQADGLIEEMEKGNEIALGSLGTKMARSMGEVGVLTDQDVKRYIQAQSLVRSAMDSFGKNFMGKLSPQTIKDIKEVTKKMKVGFQAKRKALVKEYVDQTYENFGKDVGMNRDDVMRRFGFKVKAAAADKKEVPEGKVRIQLPDGKTGMIPKEKLKEAKERGAKEI